MHCQRLYRRSIRRFSFLEHSTQLEEGGQKPSCRRLAKSGAALDRGYCLAKRFCRYRECEGIRVQVVLDGSHHDRRGRLRDFRDVLDTCAALQSDLDGCGGQTGTIAWRYPGAQTLGFGAARGPFRTCARLAVFGDGGHDRFNRSRNTPAIGGGRDESEWGIALDFPIASERR